MRGVKGRDLEVERGMGQCERTLLVVGVEEDLPRRVEETVEWETVERDTVEWDL